MVGPLGDKPQFRKRIFLGGLGLLIISSVGFALARRIWLLVVARVFQAFASAVVRSAGLATLKDAASPDAQGKALGFVGMSTTAGMVVGPAVSGLVYSKLGYGAVWAIVGILLTLDIVMRALMVDPTQKVKKPERDASAYGCPRPLSGVNEASHQQADESTPFLQQNKNSHPPPTSTFQLLKLLLRRQQMMIALYLTLIAAFLLSSFESILPLFLRSQLGADSGQVSVLFVAVIVPLGLAPLVGMLSDKYGVHPVTLTGLVLGAPSFVCLRFITHFSPSQIGLLVCLLFVCGLTCTTLSTLSMTECSIAAGKVEQEERDERLEDEHSNVGASAFAVLNISTGIGQIIGPLVGEVAMRSIGWNGSVLILGISCAVSCLVMFSLALKSHESSRKI